MAFFHERTVAMTDTTLTAFVEAALRAGTSRGEIGNALIAAGWPADQIAEGIGSFAEVDFIVPVPKPKAQLLARDAFLYLVMFTALYLSAFYLGDLLFQFVNLAFPDELEDRVEYVYSQIRWATSTIIVAFPIFVYVSYRTLNEIALDATRRTSSVRRWLTYLTLFVAAFIIVGDLISLVFNLLSGGLSARFLLKTIIVGLVAGVIFGYYLWSMRVDDKVLAR